MLSRIVIKDACIFFDLIDLGLLDDFFKLDVTVITTSFVIAEINDPRQLAIVESLIGSSHVSVFNDGDFGEILEISEANPGLSLADCSILELAARMPGMILSADKSLRNEARRRNFVVKGVLWVINELYENGYVSKDWCLEKLDLYPVINRRAPIKHIEMLRIKLTG